MKPSKAGLAVAALLGCVGLWAGGVLPARAEDPATCRQQTEPNVAPCIAQINASLQNPSVCQYMANGQAQSEYLRCYLPMVLCDGIPKAQAEAQASADAQAGLADAKAKGYCK
jgi:hypothetical protein